MGASPSKLNKAQIPEIDRSVPKRKRQKPAKLKKKWLHRKMVIRSESPLWFDIMPQSAGDLIGVDDIPFPYNRRQTPSPGDYGDVSHASSTSFATFTDHSISPISFQSGYNRDNSFGRRPLSRVQLGEFFTHDNRDHLTEGDDLLPADILIPSCHEEVLVAEEEEENKRKTRILLQAQKKRLSSIQPLQVSSTLSRVGTLKRQQSRRIAAPRPQLMFRIAVHLDESCADFGALRKVTVTTSPLTTIDQLVTECLEHLRNEFTIPIRMRKEGVWQIVAFCADDSYQEYFDGDASVREAMQMCKLNSQTLLLTIDEFSL